MAAGHDHIQREPHQLPRRKTREGISLAKEETMEILVQVAIARATQA
jgi:hypothetical protein